MLARVARRSVPVLVVALGLFAALLAPVGASAFAGLAPALRELAARPTPTDRVARPLAGKVVGIDPGHNGGNFSDPTFINQPVWNGREEEACDTTGTETNAGYTEARYRVAFFCGLLLAAMFLGIPLVVLFIKPEAQLILLFMTGAAFLWQFRYRKNPKPREMPVRSYLCEIIDTQRREIGAMRARLKQKNTPNREKSHERDATDLHE